jgi:phosphohistidine phosphatase
MELLILRHAEAEPYAASDSQRALTPRGIVQARLVGNFCLSAGLLPEVILTSPYVRTVETARYFAEVSGSSEAIHCQWMGCGMSPEMACDGLSDFEKMDRVLMIGHEPDLGCLIGHLLGIGGEGAIRVRKASLISVSLHRVRRGAGELQFLLPAKLLSVAQQSED